jgi:hypothetical protein
MSFLSCCETAMLARDSQLPAESLPQLKQFCTQVSDAQMIGCLEAMITAPLIVQHRTVLCNGVEVNRNYCSHIKQVTDGKGGSSSP